MLAGARELPLSAAPSDLQVRLIGPPLWGRTTPAVVSMTKPMCSLRSYFLVFVLESCIQAVFPRETKRWRLWSHCVCHVTEIQVIQQFSIFMTPKGIVLTEDRRQWATASMKADINSDEYQMVAAGNAISRAQRDALKPCRFSGFNQWSLVTVPGWPTAAAALLRRGCDRDADSRR